LRLARLRVLVPPGNAIVGIDLASDKQAVVVTDHDSRVCPCALVVGRKHGIDPPGGSSRA
jgi:hypothetical protein